MLEVNEIFSSLMGEGPYVGTPCYFVRFSGCNLRCSFCIGVKPARRIPRIIAGDGPNKKITEVKVGDKLLAMDMSGKLVETEVKEMLSRTVSEYYGIKIEGKPWLYFTAEHPIRINRGWIEVKDLKIGDEVFFITPNEKIRFHKRNYNPMFHPECVKKAVLHTDYKKLGKKISETRKKLIKEGKLKVPFQIWKEEDLEKYENTCKQFSDRMKKNNPMRNPEVAKKVASVMRILMKGRKLSKEHREKIALAMIGDKNPMRRPEVAARSWMGHQRRPTSIEKKVIDIARRYGFSITYVGNGKMWVGSKECKLYNPDFVVNGQKKLIEVYDPTYRHRDEAWCTERASHFNRYGYECLMLGITRKISDEEILQTLRNFISNGLKVQSVKKYSPKRYPCLGPKPLRVYNFRCEPHNNFFVDYILVHNCDTKYTWERGKQVSTENLLSSVLKLRGDTDMVVLTGGEPLLQELGSLLDFCTKLRSLGFKILVETNGTMEPPNGLLKVVDIWSISPKLQNSGQEVRYGDFGWLKNAKEWYLKFVIRTPDQDIREVKKFLREKGLPSSKSFLQPANEPSVDYIERTKELVRYVLKTGQPFKVVSQLHVLLGLR